MIVLLIHLIFYLYKRPLIQINVKILQFKFGTDLLEFYFAADGCFQNKIYLYHIYLLNTQKTKFHLKQVFK